MQKIEQSITTEKINKEKINKMTNEYYKYLCAPMDDMWEKAIIGQSNYYKISLAKKDIGYFCLDDKNILLQYYISNDFLDKSKELFKHILCEYEIKQAHVSTIEPRYLSLCMDFQNNVTTHTYLFTDMFKVDRKNPIEDAEVHLASLKDLEEVLYYTKHVGIDGEWVVPYYENIIPKKQLHLLKVNDEIIGSGEIRPSEMQKAYANLGMTVSKKYRRQGLASYILTYLKEICYKKQLIPICSTTIENIGSQKAIKNAGLFAYHRVLKVDFK